ncbi:MAG: cobalamin-dependent protein [Desulfobacterales bacterium]|nr:cobalamin-dependent protein [Desulfobacterales bacterium]
MNPAIEPITVLLVALYRYQNFPIRILHSLLEKIEGVEPHTIFFKNHYTNAVTPPTVKEEALFKEKIAELQPKMVGFSVYSPYVPIARKLTTLVKEHSSALVMWGGIHPTLSPENCLEQSDIVCIGEGEGALEDLVVCLRDGKDYHSIDNLWIRQNGMRHKNPLRPLIQNLDSVPYPAYARDAFYFIGSNNLSRKDPAIVDPILATMPARGCPFSCSYCVNSLLRPLYRGLGFYNRRRSAANVIAEMQEILTIPGNKKEQVEFHDENFGTDESWLNDFEALYPKQIGLPFKVQYNPKLIKPDLIARLKRCGLHRIKFGIESGSDYIRNQIFKRPGKNTEILKLAHQISQYDVKIRYDLIIDNPYDTEQTLKETIGLLLKLPKPLRFNLYSLQYFPEYPLTRQAIQDGHISEQEASLDHLNQKMARNWAFVPRLLPLNKKQMMNNIIWLMVCGRAKDAAVQQAVFSDGYSARVKLARLSVKAIFWGKIQALQRIMQKKS